MLWPFIVEMKLCGRRSEDGRETFFIGCYTPNKSANFENAMRDEGYSTCISYRDELFSGTNLTFQFDGCYQIFNENAMVSFR